MLRVRALSRRRAIPSIKRRQASRKAANALLRSRFVRPGSRIGVYLAHASELDTKPLIRALHHRGVQIFVPVVRQRQGTMIFVRLHETTPVVRSGLRVMQPATRRPACPLAQLDIIIIPIIGFDCKGRRIGQGGGYYDRTLYRARTRRRPKKWGFAYKAQELNSIPDEPWDLTLDSVVTERGFQHIKR